MRHRGSRRRGHHRGGSQRHHPVGVLTPPAQLFGEFRQLSARPFHRTHRREQLGLDLGERRRGAEADQLKGEAVAHDHAGDIFEVEVLSSRPRPSREGSITD